jgi:hypothetical protein
MLSPLERTLATAHGLAMAATVAVEHVEPRTPDGPLGARLRQMHDDAVETRRRCLRAERAFGEEDATEMLAHAHKVNERGADLVGAWFKAGTEPIQAWMFLAMGEAAEVAAWRSFARLLREADGGPHPIRKLVEWALPLQERHLDMALDGAASLQTPWS